MSHITKIETVVTNLDAVKAMCKRMGWEFCEGQKTYKWYGRFVGDTKLPDGLKISDLGKCSHAIKIPGAIYEVGLREQEAGKYIFAFDYWGPGGLQAAVGQGGEKLRQLYSLEISKITAQKQGHMCQELPQENGDIKLKVMVG